MNTLDDEIIDSLGNAYYKNSKTESALAYFCGYLIRGPFAGSTPHVFSIQLERHGLSIYVGEHKVNKDDVTIDASGCISFHENLDVKILGHVLAYLFGIKGASRQMIDLNFFRL